VDENLQSLVTLPHEVEQCPNAEGSWGVLLTRWRRRLREAWAGEVSSGKANAPDLLSFLTLFAMHTVLVTNKIPFVQQIKEVISNKLDVSFQQNILVALSNIKTGTVFS
jgi:hypothetical protein